jgi:hypothetical protein
MWRDGEGNRARNRNARSFGPILETDQDGLKLAKQATGGLRPL